MFNSNNSYFRIVAHNPNTLKVRAITGAYNLHDVELEDETEEFQDAHHSDQLDQLKQPDIPLFHLQVPHHASCMLQ